MAVWFGWIGALAMVSASFLINHPEGKLLAIIGLSFLTVQSWENKTHNLTLLNIVSMVGFVFSLLS